MKLFFVIFCLIVTVLCFSACEKTPDYSTFISQVRFDILCGKNDNLTLLCYAEQRETPYAYDGVSNPLENLLIFKFDKEICNLTLTFTTDKVYTLNVDNTLNRRFWQIKVNQFPTNSLTVTITTENGQENLVLNSVKTTKTLSYNQAINSLKKQQPELFEEINESGNLYEINVRLLWENNFLYYFVGLSQNGKTNAFLLDAENGNVISKKLIDHQ